MEICYQHLLVGGSGSRWHPGFGEGAGIVAYLTGRTPIITRGTPTRAPWGAHANPRFATDDQSHRKRTHISQHVCPKITTKSHALHNYLNSSIHLSWIKFSTFFHYLMNRFHGYWIVFCKFFNGKHQDIKGLISNIFGRPNELQPGKKPVGKLKNSVIAATAKFTIPI